MSLVRIIIAGEAEILLRKTTMDGKNKFYVHYLDCNRRLDEWVTENSLDLRTVHVPQKIKKNMQLPASFVNNTLNAPGIK